MFRVAAKGMRWQKKRTSCLTLLRAVKDMRMRQRMN